MALDELKNAAKVIGTKQVIKQLTNGEVRKIYIAGDAEPHVIEPIKELCRQKHIEIEIAESMQILGRAVGIEVGSATVALLND